MKELNLDDLKQLLLSGRRAMQYAWDHYEELSAREPAYILYGPYGYGIGAAIPGEITPKSLHNLTEKTRRKSYLIYELDSEYRLLRVRHIEHLVNNRTYLCFELDGVQYACPFAYDRKEETGHSLVFAQSWKDGKPYYYGSLSEGSILTHFFEYPSQEKVLVTAYYYYPVAKYTGYGYLTDHNAPIGEPSSPGQKSCWEEAPRYTNFSQFFGGTAAAEQQKEVSQNSRLADWIDKILHTDLPDTVAAFCFNLYEEGDGEWSMELVGAGRFDPVDTDWPCDEITDFNSRENLFRWEMECRWEDALAYMVKELKEYLANGKYAQLLKSRKGIGVGFVDGDIEIIV